MTNDEFDALIAAEKSCTAELYEARKKLFYHELSYSTVMDIIFACKRYLDDPNICSHEAQDFFKRVYADAVETHFTLDNERKILSLKVKELEERML